MSHSAYLKSKFQSLYGGQGGQPTIFRAPGRVNLIGEHTDYNDGFVMPAAIDLHTWVAVGLRSDRKLLVCSENFPDRAEFDLDEVGSKCAHHWSDYVFGVAVVLEKTGYRLRGANLLVRSELPIGSGLSSSAALEVAAGCALLDNSRVEIDRVELARLCQQAENEFVGMRCGVMDQFICCCAQADRALLLDCRSLGYRLLPLNSDVKLVICNTMVQHALASGQYNARRAECESGVWRLAQVLPGVAALRDVELGDLETHRAGLTDVMYRRCRHVIGENARVIAAARALEQGDLITFGKLMGESHRSLRDDYQVSCPELDLMVELAVKITGVYGARMTGAGFGGCTVNLVKADSVDRFKQTVARQYQEAVGRVPEIYAGRASAGVEKRG